MQNYKRLCALLIMLCLVVGMMPLGAIAAEDTETKIVKQQVLLGEDLTMRFYANISQQDRENGVMHIRVANRNVRYTLKDMTPNADGHYVFSVDLAAPEMTENITLTLEKEAVNGQLKIGGVWYVSKEDYTKIQIGDKVVDLKTGGECTPVVTEYLQATMPAYENSGVGATSSLVTIGEDKAWGGIVSQATMTAAEGISLIGSQKSVVIDSPINEGFFSESGPTYPLFAVNCGWRELNVATQDLLFYIELPEASSSIRLNSLCCNSWSVYPTGQGMQYQYLAADALQWQSGTVSNDNNRTLVLTPGFKGYVRLKVDTSINADTFPGSKILKVQEFSFQAEKFGGDYGSIKLGGVWFVSKEDFTHIQVDGGAVSKMTTAEDPNGRDYLLGMSPASEGAEVGQTSTLITIQEDKPWGGIASQATMQSTYGMTPLGEYRSTVIDSPICEGYFNPSSQTYPIMAVNCGWKELDIVNQDLMFYVELPAASSGLRINSFTCNSWSFWVAPAGMQYQYLPVQGAEWIDGTISADNNKNLVLPQGFKGYVRLKVNTAGNAAAFPAETLKIQDFSFQCDRFGGTPVLRTEYSVRNYAQYILNNNYTVETKNLVKQMLNYGAKAQQYFGYRLHKQANAGYEIETAATIADTAPEVIVQGRVDGISVYGCTVALQSKLAVRYYFYGSKDLSEYTFRVGGKEVVPVVKDGMFYVEDSGITPDRMDTLTTVTVSKDGQELSVQYSPMYYISRMYNKSTTSQTMKELLLAANGYFEAAKVFTGVAENESVNGKIALAPLYGNQDALLEYNPDRGWRLEAYVNAAGSVDNAARELVNALEYYKDYNPQLCQVYFYLNGFNDTLTIPQTGFDCIQKVFDTARARGIKLIVRFAYESDMEGTGEATDETMLAHIPQLKPILEKNVDVIHTVEAGFLGAWGEWHSYKLEHDELAILKAILDMVPDSLYVQVRYPRVKNLLIDAEPNHPDLQRIGYHDDSFFGWQYAKWNDGLNPGEVHWEQMRVESPYAPQGGEMFWGCQYNNWDPTTGEMAIRKYSAFHQTSFSLYHSFIEDGLVHWVKEIHKEDPDAGYYSIRDWQEQAVTTDWLDSQKIPYDPCWFQDENGQSLDRTAFEFVQDHLGYRLRALNLSMDGTLGCGEKLQVAVELKNTGFSAAFNMESGLAILDIKGNVVSTVAAGDPETWLPADLSTNAPLTHTVAADFVLPQATGTYQIAFYVRNSAGTGARLANDLPFVNGYTILQTIELR